MNENIDMGEMTSKEIGDLMSKTLIERGKEVAKKVYPGVDYGNLPSKTLTELGKQVLSHDGVRVNNNNNNNR